MQGPAEQTFDGPRERNRGGAIECAPLKIPRFRPGLEPGTRGAIAPGRRRPRPIGRPRVRASAAAARVATLDGRAPDRAKTAEHAAVARPGTQQRAATRARIEPLARVGRHRLGLGEAAFGAGDGRLELQGSHAAGLSDERDLSVPRPARRPKRRWVGDDARLWPGALLPGHARGFSVGALQIPAEDGRGHSGSRSHLRDPCLANQLIASSIAA